MITSITNFIKYFEGVRRRTLNYIRVLPPERLAWAPREGEFTCADIIRHFGVSERMFVRVALEGVWHYAGHDSEEDASLDELIAALEAAHRENMEKLARFLDEDLTALRFGPKGEGEGYPLKAWRWLMAMTEHEIHHRSQLAVYLTLMGVQPPHIFGLGVEDLIALSVT